MHIGYFIGSVIHLYTYLNAQINLHHQHLTCVLLEQAPRSTPISINTHSLKLALESFLGRQTAVYENKSMRGLITVVYTHIGT